MRSRIVRVVVLSLLAVTALYAKSKPDPTAKNPFQNSEAARAAGKKLFMRHCAECHGQAAEGTDRAPSPRQFARYAPPRTLHWFIKNGNLRLGMPSWSRLPDQQLWQLVTYLQSLEPEP